MKKPSTHNPELKAREEKYFKLYDNSPDMYVAIDPDDASIKNCNQRVVQRTGYTKEELIGHPIFFMYHPDCMPNVKKAFQFFAETGLVVNAELAVKKKDGSKIPVLLNAEAVRDEGGKILYCNSCWRDISEIKLEEKKFRILLESSPDAMVIANEEGIIQIVNTQTESVFGYKKGELVGKKVEMLVPKRFHTIHPEHRDNFVKNPGIRNMGSGLELWGQRKNREEFPADISLSTLQTEKGLLVISAIRDITKRKKLENKLATAQKDLEKKVEKRTRELKASNRELEQFAYVASHDLQEPLRKVRSFAELLKNEYTMQLDETAQEYMNYIVDGATRMQYLIRDLLSYSRVGSGELKISKTNLKKIVEEITKDLEIRIKESQAKITCNSLPELEVEPVLIKQLLQNLIDNGLKYRSDKSPRIAVSATQKNNFWQISVSDNGVGIDPDFFERIFIIFQRLHTHEEYPGTGIGLAICKKIVELHGGKIWLESEPDKGATVYFTVASDLKNRRNTKYSESS